MANVPVYVTTSCTWARPTPTHIHVQGQIDIQWRVLTPVLMPLST